MFSVVIFFFSTYLPSLFNRNNIQKQYHKGQLRFKCISEILNIWMKFTINKHHKSFKYGFWNCSLFPTEILRNMGHWNLKSSCLVCYLFSLILISFNFTYYNQVIELSWTVNETSVQNVWYILVVVL